MKMSLGSFTLAFLAAAAFGLSASNADAAQESNKPYSLIVAFSAGGPADAAARALQPGLSDAVGNTVIVENFPGAGGSIGVNRMLAREPDGRAVLMATVAEPILPPLVMSQAGYQPQDLHLLTAVIDSYLGIVTGHDAPFSSTAELIEWAKQNPEH